MSQTQDPTFYRTPAPRSPRRPRSSPMLPHSTRRAVKDAHGVVDCDAVLVHLRSGCRLVGAADRRQRIAPLRLERLLERAVPRGPRHGAPSSAAT